MADTLGGTTLPCQHSEAFGIRIELVLTAEGRFNMGSANEYFSEAPIHEVTSARPFYLGRFPITQRQWISICSQNPSEFQLSADHPVDNVSWLDATRFCDLPTGLTGRRVRLPSEAEWECACRAGSTGEFLFSTEGPFLDDSIVRHRNRRELLDFAWFDENSRGTIHPVGVKKPNRWGLHDITGNVWEWCADHRHNDYVGAPADGQPWKSNAERPVRCLRGGAWDMNALRCRSTYRSWDWEDSKTNRFGFRVCVE